MLVKKYLDLGSHFIQNSSIYLYELSMHVTNKQIKLRIQLKFQSKII